ncbi:MAG TPA: sugar ABC transporter ATP-binding protein [Tepidisphaeraceae bacterium]|jgi:simple sugar transport system ATP-binding protein
MSVDSSIVLSAREITKRFAGVVALDGVNLSLRRGEVHALMGENGAGKSTLIKVINGVYRADGGSLLMDGQAVEPANPLHAERLGIRTVHQELMLVPQRSVMENLSLGQLPTRFGMIRWREVKRRAQAALATLGVQIDVARPLGHYSAAIRQLVAIARAVGEPDRRGAATKVLILDEPTSSLDSQEVARLFAILNQLKSQGMAIVFVSHFLDEIYQISDRITVLRNGRFVGEWKTAELPKLDLVATMLGKQLESARHEAAAARQHGGADATAVAVSVRGLARRGVVGPVSFDIPAGKTVGLAGLLGSGRSETARLCFGADAADEGEMRVGERRVNLPRSPRRAMKLGIAMTGEDRKTDGIFPNLSVRENIALALQSKMGAWRALTRRRQCEIAEKFRAALGIKTPHLEQPIRLLSGGNQQKCLIARWLATQPMLLILDEPTRGIDVGAKADVERLVRALCDEGASVLFISSELKEVVDVSDDVVVLRDRRQVAVLHEDEISERSIMRIISGGEGTRDAGEVSRV